MSRYLSLSSLPAPVEFLDYLVRALLVTLFTLTIIGALYSWPSVVLAALGDEATLYPTGTSLEHWLLLHIVITPILSWFLCGSSWVWAIPEALHPNH